MLDTNNDRTNDLIFCVLLVGDQINKVDKYKFNVVSSFQTCLPVNINEQSPAFNNNMQIPIADFEEYEWYNVSEITLFEKNIFSTGNIKWLGNWLGEVKKYLPVQIEKDGKRFNGWVKIREDKPNESMILHQAAISKESGKAIEAGN